MINFTLNQLRYFEALVRHGHFGRAADACAIWGPLKREAWEQAGGEGWLDVDTSTDPQIMVLRQAGKL